MVERMAVDVEEGEKKEAASPDSLTECGLVPASKVLNGVVCLIEVDEKHEGFVTYKQLIVCDYLS